MKKKIGITIILAILLIGLYVIIYGFSAEESNESSSRSLELSKKCVNIADSVSGKKWSEKMKEEKAEEIEHPIRKLAHFSEYCLSGILLFLIWIQWMPRNKRFYFFLILWIALSAMADEFHQLFVEGRDGNLLDVSIDTTGGCFGLLLCTVICILIDKRRQKKKTKEIK